MELQAALPIIAVFLYIASSTSPVSATCSYVDFTTDKCSSAAGLRVNGRSYHKGSSGQIDLPHTTREIYWYCGSSRERTGWGGIANRLDFWYDPSGTIYWSIFRCNRCTTVARTNDNCRSAPFIKVLPGGKIIYKNTFNQVVKLPGMQNQVFWYCGGSRERTGWARYANELSVNYFSDGRIEWVINKCG